MKEGTPSKSKLRRRAFVALAVVGGSGVAALAACSDDDCAKTATCAGNASGGDSGAASDGNASMSDGNDSDASAVGHVTLTAPTTTSFAIQGGFVDVAINVQRTGYDGELTLKATGLPEKITSEPVTVPAGATTATLRLTATTDREQGAVSGVGVTGTASGAVIDGADIRLFVRGPSGSVDTTFGTIKATASALYQAVTPDEEHIIATFGGLARRFFRDGGADPTFGDAGDSLLPYDVTRLLIDDTGRLVIAGFDYVFALEANGSPAKSFADGGATLVTGYDEFISDLELGPGHTIYATLSCEDPEYCKPFGTPLNASTLSLKRLTANGRIDTNLHAPSGVTLIRPGGDTPYYSDDGSTVVAADGRSWSAYRATAAFGVSRVSADGTTFKHLSVPAVGGVPTDTPLLSIDSSNRLLLTISGAKASDAIAVHRYNADLEIDTSFGAVGVASGFAGTAKSSRTFDDGSLMVAGIRPMTVDHGYEAVIERFAANGDPDTTYGVSGVAVSPNITALGAGATVKVPLIQQDGSVIVIAEAGGKSFLLRLWQ